MLVPAPVRWVGLLHSAQPRIWLLTVWPPQACCTTDERLLPCAQATHEVAGREGLLALLQRAPDGTRLGDLRDAYPGAADDAAALAADGQAWLLPGGDTFDAVTFPRPPAPMPVSDEVAAAWHATEARLAATLRNAVPCCVHRTAA